MALSKEPAATQVDVAVNSATNLAEVQALIAAAAQAAGRSAGEVVLVAVSKTQGAEDILPVIQAGQRLFGENRVQEAQGKWPDLKAAHPDLRLHLIGPLQTNKVKDAVALFDVIETVDRPKLARVLAKEMAKQDRRLDCFIQVNTGEEEQKAGIWPEDADAFIALVRDELGLSVRGLMCIPPVEEECSLHFALLREIAQRNGLEGLSMGMSADYEVAIQFGATLVRVGTAIFGARKPHP
ncbi:MAG TPA: YggS family pyridoxal phosphate-dependent enzyme [Alphaproteobacteria bacterium]|jgi:pyridoxal phosphate enzyme (YggS family)|nr:YggS family pyridoxal phosphate-dependent enzyme [Alphaproteobacteria bacterium]|tara:strand:- start:1193 stop:1909 length:717 start_codon:yes stop_codon:yes gene_type:complete